LAHYTAGLDGFSQRLILVNPATMSFGSESMGVSRKRSPSRKPREDSKTDVHADKRDRWHARGTLEGQVNLAAKHGSPCATWRTDRSDVDKASPQLPVDEFARRSDGGNP
jgi:hypothetical protein